MAPNIQHYEDFVSSEPDDRIRCAILGCGMMGQEHISYIMGYAKEIRLDFLCDPYPESIQKAKKMMEDFADPTVPLNQPTVFTEEEELLQHVEHIDLLVIASPNYMHTPTLLRWGRHDLTILCEKPVAVSQEQHDELLRMSQLPDWQARIWVAMEYRYIPAIAKLLSLIPTIGELKMVTIRENRFPFLHKIGKWNRDREKTGDTLVEKCCHFFDLFRLITGKEAALSKVQALAQRDVNYHDEPDPFETPIIDSAYVTMPFLQEETSDKVNWSNTIGCLEICMFADYSRHQEEIVLTGSKGRLEAYLPENKVYAFQRPSQKEWSNRSIPPTPSSIHQKVFDCSDVKSVHGIDSEIPTHGGYHYCSTAVEWHYLLGQIKSHRNGRGFEPQVSLKDGLRAVEIGIHATSALINDVKD